MSLSVPHEIAAPKEVGRGRVGGGCVVSLLSCAFAGPPFPGWLELVRVFDVCLTVYVVSDCLHSWATLVYVCLNIVPLPSSSSSPTVTGRQLGGYPAGRDWWGGDHNVGRVLTHIDIDTNVWVESSIMTGVYESGARLLCTLDGVCVIIYV